jgi:hypothetical protein
VHEPGLRPGRPRGRCRGGQLSCAGLTSIFQQYRSECHCGDSTKVNIASAQAAASDCQATCTGNAGQICGGAGRLSIYKRPASAGPAPVDSSKNPTPITVDQGCFKDRSDQQGRALSNYYGLSANDNVKCVTNCKNAGFKYAATE